MLRSEWDVCRFWRVANWCEYCRSMHKAPYLGCLPGAALSQHEITCLRGFLAAWCQQRLGKPDEGYQVSRLAKNHSGSFSRFLLNFVQFLSLDDATDAGCCHDDAAGSAREHRNREGELWLKPPDIKRAISALTIAPSDEYPLNITVVTRFPPLLR